MAAIAAILVAGCGIDTVSPPDAAPGAGQSTVPSAEGAAVASMVETARDATPPGQASHGTMSPTPGTSAPAGIPLPSGEVCDDTGGDVSTGLDAPGAGVLPTLAIPGFGSGIAIATSSFARATSTPSGPTPTPGPTLPPGSFARPRVAVEGFAVAPTLAAPGGRVVLSWRAIGDAADLHALSDQGRLSDPTPVAPVGTLEAVVPDDRRDVMRWVLMVRAGGARTSAEAKIALSCPFTWFFADPPSDCPAAPAAPSAMAAQRFEHGLMLWSGQRYIVDVLFDADERWAFFADDWDDGMPESDPSLRPPAGLIQPARGFGRVWREGDGVRESLGWAIGSEIDLGQGAYQCDANRQPTCYVTGPDGTVLALQMGTWWAWGSGAR